MPLHDSFQRRTRTNLVKMSAVPSLEDLVFGVSNAQKTQRKPVFLAWQSPEGVRVLSIISGLEPGTEACTWVLRAGESIDAPIIWKHVTIDAQVIHAIISQELNQTGPAAVIPEFLRPGSNANTTESNRSRHSVTADLPVYEAGMDDESWPSRRSEKLNPDAEGDDDEAIGTVFADRYEIVGEIGKGAMGMVYKARQRVIDRFVALKVLHPHLLSKEINKKRFEFEARAASSLHHPNLIIIHDFGMSPRGRPFLVMDYVEGPSLQEVLTEQRCLNMHAFLSIFIQCCQGLSHAHKRGVVHRDLKPSNIRLAAADAPNEVLVKVLDFGIAKTASREGEDQRLTRTGDIIGSPLYMSPEQCRGESLDGRSDIYSIGCMMYQCATGILPFVGKDPFETMYKHIYEKAHPFDKIRPDVQFPAELERIIFKALDIDLSRRYATVDELLADLELLRTQDPEVMQISAPAGLKPRAPVSVSQAVTQIEISAPGLLRQAGIIAPQDLDTIAKLTAEVGGDTASILLATGKLEPSMLDAANTCKKWIELGKMNISQAIILLNYCFRARSNFNEAMTELGWTLPGVS